jgi:hypothetical protein
MFRSISAISIFAVAIMILAAVPLGANNLAIATSNNDEKTAAQKSFGPIKQINAGLLNVGYVEAGPANGTPVILLHGWPSRHSQLC